jgi:hypothetical protein
MNIYGRGDNESPSRPHVADYQFIDAATSGLGGEHTKFTKRQPLKWMLRQMIIDAFSSRDKHLEYKNIESPTARQRQRGGKHTRQYETDLEWMQDPIMRYENGFAFEAVCDWLDIDRGYVLKQFLGGCPATPPENRGADWPIWGKKPHHLEEISVNHTYQSIDSNHKWNRSRKARWR